LADWEAVVDNGLTAHFCFAKAVIPVLEAQEKGQYFMVNGGASEYVVPHSGVISVVAAAQK
jgi:NADP-dependent 3-hydroxy acid dehydrogenase YdfG